MMLLHSDNNHFTAGTNWVSQPSDILIFGNSTAVVQGPL